MVSDYPSAMKPAIAPRLEASLLELTPDDVGGEQVAIVAAALRPHLRLTPTIRLDRSELGLAPGPLVLKLEQLQHGGSFKARGAFANMLLHDIPKVGVVAASGGNHGAAVAFAARRLGVPATIFVPEISSSAKTERIRSYGATLVVGGSNYDDARLASETWRAESGALDIPAFDAIGTVLGAGSLALELHEQTPDADTVLAAVGGGGLLAGLCAGSAGRFRVVGVEPEGAPTLTRALEAGEPVEAEAGSIAVDSLAPRRIGRQTLSVITRLGSGCRLVEDEAIRGTQHLLWDRLRLVLEPGGCAALAAIVSGRYQPARDEVVTVVLSGANTSAVSFL